MVRSPLSRLVVVVIFAAATSCALCSPVLADSTLTVNHATGSDTGNCQTHPCQTIGYALSQAGVIGGSATLTVAAGDYDEDLTMPAGVEGMRIVGAGNGTDPSTDTIITGSSGLSTIETGSASSVSLADLRVIDPPGDGEDMVSAPITDLSLTGVVLDQQASEGNPINALAGNVTFSDGTISIDDPSAAGYAINDRGGDIAVSDTAITIAGGGYGLNAINGAITATHTTIDLTNPSEYGFAMNTRGAINAENDTLTVAGHGFGVNAVGPITVNETTLALTNPSSYAYGVNSASSISATGDEIALAGEGGFAINSVENVTLDNSTVTLSNPVSSGDGANAGEGITASGDHITVAGDGCGLFAGTTIDLDASTVTLTNSEERPCGANAGADFTGKNDTITDLGGDSAIYSTGNLTLSDSKIAQSQTSNGPPAVRSDGQARIENVQISAGQDSAFASVGTTTIIDSRFSMAAGSTRPAVSVRDGEASGHTVLARRSSVLDQTPDQSAIHATNTDLTLDSALVSGGTGIAYDIGSGDSRTLTVSASTIDADTPGVRDEDANSLIATVDSDPASIATVNIEGSILLETPAAQRPNSTGAVTIDCTNSETPNVNQTQAGTVGDIDCATANHGNTYTPTVADIFADPGHAYSLNPLWHGVDSVKPEAITLPDITPSATDLASSARAQNAAHTCLSALQDKGALESPGYPGTQPEPVIDVPDQILAGELATFTATAPAGTALAWRDSNGASSDNSTFTDTFPAPGRYTITVLASGAPGCRQTTSITITAKHHLTPPDPVPLAANTATLACDRARITLTDVAIKHHHVVLSGVAEPRLADKQVRIFSAGRPAASATVSRDGSFAALAPLPPAGIRATNTARYQARIDGIRSLDLKLTRRLVLEPPTSAHGMVTLQGRVLAPFTSPHAPILVWQENTTCTHARLIAKITPSTDGHYTISLPAPARQRSAIYRLSTRVQATPTNHRSFATFSLTEAVKLK